MEKDLDKIVDKILGDFKTYTNSFGEPQTFIDAENNRCVEIVHEKEGLEESEEFYRCFVHGTEEDFENEMTDEYGVIEEFWSDNTSIDELKEVIKVSLECARNTPVAV